MFRTVNPTGVLSEFDSLNELKEATSQFEELRSKFEYELIVPFMEYYGKYYRIVEDIPKPKEGMTTLFDLININEDSALFVVHGYTETIREINPNPTPPENPDNDPEDYYLETQVHTRERFVSFPLDFLEKKDEYFQKAAEVKAEQEVKKVTAAKEAAEAELKKIERRAEELKAVINNTKAAQS